METPQVNFVQPGPMHPHIYNDGHICLGGKKGSLKVSDSIRSYVQKREIPLQMLAQLKLRRHLFSTA